MPHLTILSGESRGKIYALESSSCRIGRDGALEVPIVDSRASRIHVEITLKDGKYVMRDLKSKNGTLVNGTSVTALTLKEGDQIEIGETRLAFSLEDAPAARTKGRQFDSVMATRLPLGAVPALGTAGVAGDKNSAENFETLELNAPLALLDDESAQPEDATVQDLRGSAPDDVEATPLPTRKRVVKAPPAHNAERIERANRSLRALCAIARAVTESGSSAALLNGLSAGLLTALNAGRVTPVRVDAKGAVEVPEGTIKVARGNAPFSKVPLSRTIIDYALRTHRSVLTAPRGEAGANSAREQGITSAICVPIISRDVVLALIYADRLGGTDFTREDHELVTAACLQTAPALANLCRLELSATSPAQALPVTLADVEKNHILCVLETCGRDKKLAAEKLGIDGKALGAKLKTYGIQA